MPITLYVTVADPVGTSPPENLAVAVAVHLCSVVTDAAMLRVLVRTRIRVTECSAQPVGFEFRAEHLSRAKAASWHSVEGAMILL
ncbi:hypothetical protein GCM10010449_39970 [Streptomyces rectiviolaceus]|uniref:Uncharacterized protein n=1 Tax=Streptomyces rectiviolaceus TaxID=332591 RepID=A0ABP6MHB7_9ACTN